MQGGHRDGLQFNLFRNEVDDGESSGYESEISVMQSISLGVRLDMLLHKARVWFAYLISLPIAWLHLEASVESFRRHKLKRVKQGTDTVLWLQRTLRGPFLSMFFQVVSFCAEEEFYLLLLPILFWNVDVTLARRITMVVCLGLFVGNIMKDVFKLPRPKSPPVWRPAHQASVDSTALCDFGFPSTHSMNSVTNSGVAFLYARSVGWLDGEIQLPLFTGVAVPREMLGLAAALAYSFFLSLSRLYLGAHSPTDLRGGFSLGVLVLAIYWDASIPIDLWLTTTAFLELKCVAITVLALLLCPQPRPVTPTFAQNALLAGLLLGCVIGSRYYYELGLDQAQLEGRTLETITIDEPINSIIASQRGWLLALAPLGLKLRTDHPVVAGFVRTLSGYIVVLVLRLIVKQMTTVLLNALGVRTKPVAQEDELVNDKCKHDTNKKGGDTGESQKNRKSPPPRSPKTRHARKERVVRLFTTDLDIVGGAIVKTATYTVLAFAITFVVPFLSLVCGL